MAFAHSPKIVTDGLVFAIDPANPKSYSGTGSTVKDLIGSNNGTLSGDAVYSSDNVGVFDFDGTDDVIEFSSGSVFKPTGAMTISYWMYGYAGQGNVGGVGTMGGSGTRGYLLGAGNTGAFIYYIAINSTGLTSTSYTDTSLTGWNHLTGVFTPSESVKLYINGSLVSTTVTNTATQYQDNGISLKIGERGDGSGDRNTSISAVQMYHRALSTSEIQQNYNALKGRFGL